MKSASLNIRLIFKQGLTALVCILLSSLAHAGLVNGKFQNANLEHCENKNCIRIIMETAEEGIYPGNYAAATAKVEINKANTKEPIKLAAEDLYFDAMSKKVFIRKFDPQNPKAEAVYNLTDSQIIYFK